MGPCKTINLAYICTRYNIDLIRSPRPFSLNLPRGLTSRRHSKPTKYQSSGIRWTIAGLLGKPQATNGP